MNIKLLNQRSFTGASFNVLGFFGAAAPMGTKKSSPKGPENQQKTALFMAAAPVGPASRLSR
jgi:hypothetical protein